MSEHQTTDEVDTEQWCEKHQQQKWWVDCWNCGGEVFVDHDCGEDICCCLHPQDNVLCDICEGAGGFLICSTCSPESFDEYW